jgi:S-methylmethionine-dependent homocysteine/selenocysteine methylase
MSEATGQVYPEEPAGWPDWSQRVSDPAGGLWKVRTVDLLRAATQFVPAEARTIAATMGRYQTTIERPDGGSRTVYTAETDEAEAYHRRTVRRILGGQL